MKINFTRSIGTIQYAFGFIENNGQSYSGPGIFVEKGFWRKQTPEGRLWFTLEE